MKTRAAVAYAAGKPLVIEEVDLDGPKAGEVLVEIKATGVCHTDEFTRSGADPEGLFPVVFGHEGAGVVVEVGAGVTTLAKDDHVIPLYTPECRQCKFCLSRKTNLCQKIRATQGKGLMALLVAMMIFTGLHWSAMPPSRVETVDVKTLHLKGEFVESNLGTSVGADGKVTVRLIAQQYSFQPQCIVVPAGMRRFCRNLWRKSL